MQTFKNFILIIVLSLGGTQHLFSQTTKVNSLWQEIEKSRGEKKLELMFQVSSFYYDTDEMPNIAEQIKEEAIRQKNMPYLAGSYVLKTRYFAAKANTDSTIYYAELANKTYEEHKIANPMETYYFLCILYLRKEHYELAIHNIKIYLNNESNNSNIHMTLALAECYMEAQRFDLSKDIILNNLEQLHLNRGNYVPTAKIELYGALTRCYLHLKQYKEAFDACTMMERSLDEIKSPLPESASTDFKVQIYFFRAFIYVETLDAKNAKLHLDKLEQILPDELKDVRRYEINIVFARYYSALKDYNKSLQYIEPSLNYFREKHENDEWALVENFMELKIKNLNFLGRYKDVALQQRELINYKDSIYQQNGPLQIAQLSQTYELEKNKIEKEKNMAELKKSQTVIVTLLITSLLLCIILYILRQNVKK